MSLFRDSMRPPPIASDAALRRYLEIVRAELEPDPLFRRRLRGLVTNQFVATREGTASAARLPSRAMGRLGRGCLYASVAVAMSVGVTMAASQSAIPGDPLYPVKLRIEELRVAALPAGFQDDLAVYALTERINELGQLAQAGEVERAEALAAVIQDQIVAIAAMGLAPEAENALLASRLEVLDALVERLPPKAQQAIERAMAGAPGLVKAGPGPATGHGEGASAGAGQDGEPAAAGGAASTGDDSTGGSSNGGGMTNGGSRNDPPGQAARPSSTPEPSATPEPSPTPKEKGKGGGQGATSSGSD